MGRIFLVIVGLLALPLLVVLIIGVAPFATIYFLFQLILDYKADKVKRQMKFELLKDKKGI